MNIEAKYNGENAYVFVLRADGKEDNLKWEMARIADYSFHDLMNMDNPVHEIKTMLTASGQNEKFLYILPPSPEELKTHSCSSECIKAYSYIREALSGGEYNSISMIKARQLNGSAWSPL